MDISAVSHRSSYCECCAYDENRVIVTLKTAKDVDKAYIIHEDPFIHQLKRLSEWSGVKTEMTDKIELEHNFIWKTTVIPRYKRLQYYFIVESDGEKYFVFENRICSENDVKKRAKQYFKFPWLNPADVITPPKNISNMMWYQIMPDRFCKSETADSRNNNFMEWGKTVNTHSRDKFGGDLKGITQRLDYLKDIGIGGVYFTPVFVSDTYHRYNTFDYKNIDKDLGTNDDMAELVRKAHSLGMKVMLDGVFNHCGIEFFAWKDVVENGRKSKYADWFFLNSDNIIIKDNYDTGDGRFYSFSFWTGMPKLNTNNDEVIKYFSDICLDWVKKWDIDGIRFDVGDEVSHKFIRELRRTLKPVKPDIFLLGEIWIDSVEWLDGNEYDSVMNYPFANCIWDFYKDYTLTSRDIMYQLNRCMTMYPKQITEVLFNFLDTHDTERISESCNGNIDILIQKLALLVTMPGSPCIYYGTELALKGMNKNDNRQCMLWDKIENGSYDDILSETKQLIRLRSSEPLCADADMHFIHHDDMPRVLHIIKGCNESEKKLGIIINAGSSDFIFNDDVNIVYSKLFSGNTLSPNGTLIYTK